MIVKRPDYDVTEVNNNSIEVEHHQHQQESSPNSKIKPITLTTNQQDLKQYPYPVKTVNIRTCGQLYKKWAITRKAMYAKAEDGLIIQVEYADTIDLIQNPQMRQDPITILALHGAPGSHEDFEPFITYFGSKNIRFIAPNYPDFNITIQTEVFRHSAEEKYEYIKDFLLAINVNRIDLIMSHSSSVYPTALLLCEQDKIQIRSVALFNPAGHRRIQAMRPAWFTEGSVKVYQNKLGRFIYKIFGKGFIKVTGSVTVKPDSMDNVILSAQTMRYSNYRQLEKYLKKIKENKTPILWVLSENDRLVEKEIFDEMIELVGADDRNVQKYDEKCQIIKQYNPESNRRILYFKSGGHYAFLKYSGEVIKECDKFLKFVLMQTN